MIGIGAFAAYILFVIIWSSGFKRSITEALAIALLIPCLCCGPRFSSALKTSLTSAATSSVLYGIMLFTVMSAIATQTGIIQRLVTILNSVLGKLRGGPAYVSAFASALFGLIAGSGTGNAAAVGSITIPWMMQTGWSGTTAATMNAGNAGLGLAFPPSTPMMLMLSLPVVAQDVSTQELYVALLCCGGWSLLYRVLLVRYYVSRYQIPAIPNKEVLPLRESLRKGGSSLALFLGCIIPILLTTGPVAERLSTSEAFGSKAAESINIIIWVPILISAICLIEGRKHLPKGWPQWSVFFLKSRKTCSNVGAMSFFALAGSEALTQVGFSADVHTLLESLALPKLPTILVIGILLAVTAGPLNASATIAALGSISYLALVNVGVAPIHAVAAILLFVSTEGASPPSSAPIYISCGIAKTERISATFKPLIFHYVLPIMGLGFLTAMGLIPIHVG